MPEICLVGVDICDLTISRVGKVRLPDRGKFARIDTQARQRAEKRLPFEFGGRDFGSDPDREIGKLIISA